MERIISANFTEKTSGNPRIKTSLAGNYRKNFRESSIETPSPPPQLDYYRMLGKEYLFRDDTRSIRDTSDISIFIKFVKNLCTIFKKW